VSPASRSSFVLALVVGSVTAGCGAETSSASKRAKTHLSVEIFSADIDAHGLFFHFPRQRFDGLAAELDSSPVDVLCLQGLHVAQDREELVSAVSKTFPYAVDLPTHDDTPVSDPTTQDGQLPEMPTDPACSSADDVSRLDALLDCLGACSDKDGHLLSLPCAGGACGPEFQALTNPTDARQRCRNCWFTGLYGDASISEIRQRCKTLPGNPLGYRGDHGSLLLSKLPLESPELVVLPSEDVRRVALYARAQTPAGPVHVFCARLGITEIFDPYPGPYGSPQSGWQEEHDLQLEKLLASLEARSGGDPAVLALEAAASPVVESGGTVVTVGLSQGTLARLTQELVRAVPAGFQPACTRCPGNPLTPNSAPLWTNHVYLSGLPASAAIGATRSYLGNVVKVDPTQVRSGQVASDQVPITFEYGFRASLVLE